MTAAIVLSLDMSTMRANERVYSLTSDGKETRNGTTRNIDMDAFWAKWQTVLLTIVTARVDGWDQIRLYSQITCRPIWNFEVTEQNGGHRSFSIYGDIVKGAKLEEDLQKSLPTEYSVLYEYLTASFNYDK